MLRGRVADHVLVRFVIVTPTLAFADVARRKLPILFRFLQPLEESFLLFLLRNIQEEFADHGAAASHVSLERAYIFKALLPDFLAHQRRRNLLTVEDLRMHSDHEHLFVVGAVENSDMPTLGQNPRGAPEEIVL